MMKLTFMSEAKHRGKASLSTLVLLLGLLMNAAGAKAASEDIHVSFTCLEANPNGYETETANHLFDADVDENNCRIYSKWCFSFTSSAYVIFEVNQPLQPNGYTIQTGFDNYKYKGRNPQSWALYGSNDKSNWTLIDKVIDDNKLQDIDSQSYDYSCSSREYFKYFKWEITAGGNVLAVGRFRVNGQGKACSQHQLSKVEAKAPTCSKMGNKEYYKCAACGRKYQDASGTDGKEYIGKSYLIPAKGHSYDKGTCTVCGASFQYTVADGKVTITGYKKGDDGEEMVIPETIEGMPVVAIGDAAFITNTSFSSVVFPASLEVIGDGAFSNSSLSKVTFAIGSKLKTIGTMAFQNTKLVGMDIPASVEKVGEYAFGNNASLRAVSFLRVPASANDLVGYGDDMFHSSRIVSIKVLKGCEDLYRNQLTSYADLIQGVSDIAAYGLKFQLSEGGYTLTCKGLDTPALMANITIPESVGYPVTAISAGAFQANGFVEDITVPASVIRVESKAFADNQNLKTVSLLGNNTRMEGDALSATESLQRILVKDDAAYTYYAAQKLADESKLCVVGHLQLTDDEGWAASHRRTVFAPGALSYQRAVGEDDDYASLCLPFDVDLSQTHDIFETVYVPMSTLINNTMRDEVILMLDEQEPDAKIPAGTPMLVQMADDCHAIHLSNRSEIELDGTFKPTTTQMTMVDWDGISGLMKTNKQYAITCSSAYQPLDASQEEGIYAYNGSVSFLPQNSGTLSPFRFFLSLKATDAAAPAIQSIVFDYGDLGGGTTGIRNIITSGKEPSASSSSAFSRYVYDLSGRRVGKAADAKSLPKGIYVVNGKKIVIK